MDVITGNQPEAGRTRRQIDRERCNERSLDWATHASDILLFPHSPLALADVLNNPEGRFNLIPLIPEVGTLDCSSLNTTSQPGLETSEIAPLQSPQRRRHRSPRSRVNLLSRHTETELSGRCRQALVENALIKTRGERRFLLAAGFLSLPAVDSSKQPRRAPVLLFPALLVRKPDDTGYEVRTDGSPPELNKKLVNYCLETHGINLPPWKPGEPMTDWFALLAQSLTAVNTLKLEFNVALGNAAVNLDELKQNRTILLPVMPPHFDASLAMSITNNKSLKELRAVLHLIPNYKQPTPGSVDNDKGGASSSMAQLKTYATRLTTEGLDHIQFQNLDKLPEQIAHCVKTLQTVLAESRLLKLVNVPDISTRQFLNLAGIIELIDKAPIVIEHYGHSDLCYSSSTLLLQRAQHQARLIEEELSALQEHFILKKIPAKRQLLGLIEELSGVLYNEPDIVDADYFNARRQFMEFSCDKPANLTSEHRRRLSQLAKALRFRELFVNNTEYRCAFGPGYRGLRTDWQTLLTMSDYATELSSELESESIAASIVKHWSTFRTMYISELDSLQSAADAARRLLQLTGHEWQSRSLPETIQRAGEIRTLLLVWQKEFGDIDQQSSRTPASVLSQFSGRSREDSLVEAHVSDTRSMIDDSLNTGKHSYLQITDTLAWLRIASDKVAGHELDIDAIVDHLNIA
ncbi:MAG: DUF4011 domain-containing protein [Granulosicoccus sp.]